MANHPAEHGILFDVIVAAHLHTETDFRPFNSLSTLVPPGSGLERERQTSRSKGPRNDYFQWFYHALSGIDLSPRCRLEFTLSMIPHLRWRASRCEAMRSQRERIHHPRRFNPQNLDANRRHESALGRSADSHVRRFRKSWFRGQSCPRSGGRLRERIPANSPTASR